MASRPNNVSLANADTVQVAIQVATTLQGNASYYISNIDGVEALVELESQSANKNELTNLDFERQTEKAYPWYKTVAELAEW